MLSRNMKFLSLTAGAMAVIAALALARTVNLQSGPVDRPYSQSFGTNTVFAPDGKLIGAAPGPGIRSHIEQDGLPE
jgi:hypothetical protein